MEWFLNVSLPGIVVDRSGEIVELNIFAQFISVREPQNVDEKSRFVSALRDEGGLPDSTSALAGH